MRDCENCGRTFRPTAGNVAAGRGRFCSRICADQAKRHVAVDVCLDDPVRTPTGRPAVVRALHNDGRVDIRYTDELRDPGCTLAAAMLAKRPFKRPSAAVPYPSALERGWLPGQRW